MRKLGPHALIAAITLPPAPPPPRAPRRRAPGRGARPGPRARAAPRGAPPAPDSPPGGGRGGEVPPVPGGEQPGRGRLVHVELARHLGDSGLPVPGQDLQDGHRPVHRLHPPRVLPPRPRDSPSRPSVSPSLPSVSPSRPSVSPSRPSPPHPLVSPIARSATVTA